MILQLLNPIYTNMCKVYNQVGCLTDIDQHLNKHQISQYRTLDELMEFEYNYPLARNQIITEHTALVEQEKIKLYNEIELLKSSIEKKKAEIKDQIFQKISALNNELSDQPAIPLNFIQNLSSNLKKTWLSLKIWLYQILSKLNIWLSIRHINKELDQKNKRYNYIHSHFDDAVLASGDHQLSSIDYVHNVIQEIESKIYGALGELRVQDELKKLSDEHILINDFKIEFSKSLYNKAENDHIKTAQIDHLLVSPAGIFIIETKNWSKQSINNTELRSPVLQIKRSNYALHALLNWDKSVMRKLVRWHHWGDKKIPVRNLIVFMNYKPDEEFQYVKIETVNRILGYIKYFKPFFSSFGNRSHR